MAWGQIYPPVDWIMASSGNDFSPVRIKSITWTNADEWLTGPLESTCSKS